MSNRDFIIQEIRKLFKEQTESSGILQQLAGKDLLRAPGAFKYKGIDFSIKFNPKNMTIKAAGTQSSFTFHYRSIELNVYEAKVVNSGGVANLKMGIWINKQKAQVTNQDLDKWLPKLLAKKQVSIQAAGRAITIKPNDSNKAIDLNKLKPSKPKPKPKPKPRPEPTANPSEKEVSEGLCGLNFKIINVRDFERQIVQTMSGVTCEDLAIQSKNQGKIDKKYNYKLYGKFLTAINNGIKVKNISIDGSIERLQHYKKNVIPSANLQAYLLNRKKPKNAKQITILNTLFKGSAIKDFMSYFDEKSGIVSLYTHDIGDYELLNFAILKIPAVDGLKGGDYPVVFTSRPNAADIAAQFVTKGLKNMEFFEQDASLEVFNNISKYLGYEKETINKVKMRLVGLHGIVKKYIMTYNAAEAGKIPFKDSNIKILEGDPIKEKGIQLLEIYKGKLEYLIRALHNFETDASSETLHKLAKASASTTSLFEIIDDVVY